MKLSERELAVVRGKGFCITEKCDQCGKLLNQSFRYTIAQRPEVYCSAFCRGLALFGNRHDARRLATPGRCAYCGGSLQGKKRGAIYCNDVCRMRDARVRERTMTRRPEKSRTLGQSNQHVSSSKTGHLEERIIRAQRPSTGALAGVSNEEGSPVQMELRTTGNRAS